MAADELNETVKSLQAEVARERQLREQTQLDNQAIKEEFAKANTSEEAVETARKFIEDTLPEAIITMRTLMANSTSDSVRSSISKYVVDIVLNRKHEDSDNTAIKDLLKGLKPETANHSANHSANDHETANKEAMDN